jgi:tetratricopeptide (TPR) repeat protein
MYLKTTILKLIFISCISLFIVACRPNEQTGNTSKVNVEKITATIQELSQAIEKNPDDAELYYQRGTRYFDEKLLDRALADMDDAIKYAPEYPLYHFQKARILYAMNRTLDAEKAYQKAISLKPDFEDAKMKLAELYYVVKEHPKSIALLNDIIATNKKNTQAYFVRGMNQKEMGDSVRAIASFQKVLELNAKDYDALMQLGILLTARGHSAAKEYLTSAIKLQPRSKEAYFARAYYFQQKGKLQEALLDYKRVIELDEKNADAYYNVGMINFDAGKYKEALHAFTICIQMNQDMADAYYMRGLTHEKLGNKQDAVLNYQVIVKSGVDYPDAQRALIRLGYR